MITGDGTIEYALDDKISAYHAGFKDPDNSAGLEYGQFWNNHYLAICLSGWFSHNRIYRDATGHTHPIPNNFTVPTEAQMASLLALIQHLRHKYDISVENIRAHRELLGNSTACPGQNLDPAQTKRHRYPYTAIPGKTQALHPDAADPAGSAGIKSYHRQSAV